MKAPTLAAGVFTMTAAAYLQMMAVGSKGGGQRKNKFGNRKSITASGEKYDSGKEARHHQTLELARKASDPAMQVVEIRRQVPYLLLEKQEGERAIQYFADFVVHYADGHVEVQDTKSPPTRANPTYVMKRKMMLRFHGVRIVEL